MSTEILAEGKKENEMSIIPERAGDVAAEIAETAENLDAANRRASERVASEIESKKRGRKPKVKDYGATVEKTNLGNSASEIKNLDGQEIVSNLIDEKSAETLADGIISLLNDFSENMGEIVCLKMVGEDADLLKQTKKNFRMSPASQALIKTGLLGCIKKYGMQFEYMPEFSLILGLCGWTLSMYLTLKTLRGEQKKSTVIAPEAK